jgi:hypothetical protein
VTTFLRNVIPLNPLFEHDLSENRYPLFRIMLRRGKGGADLATPKIALAGYELLARGLLSFD